MNRPAHRLTITAVLISALALQAAALELSVSPPRLMLAVEPGNTTETVIRLSGRFARPTRIRASIGDWGLLPSGATYFEPAGSNPRSLAGWLSISPDEFILETGKIQTVRVRLEAPAGIAGGYWGVVFFQNLPEAPPAGRGMAAITTVARITTTVYAETATGAARQGKVTGVTARWTPQGELVMSTLFRNTGNVLVFLKGRFEIRDASGKTLAQMPFDTDLRVLPGAEREVTAAWQGKLKSGHYVLLALADYGARNVVAGQCSFKVP